MPRPVSSSRRICNGPSATPAGTAGHRPPGPAGSGGAAIDQVEGRVIRTPDASGIGDRNGVEVDQEMIALAENQIMYEAATQMLNKKLGLLKYVIQDGR